MFCPYCGIDHDETTQMSLEHLVPYAMGGTSEFTINVCEASNNEFGGRIDRPLIEFFPIRSARFFLGLKGTDGTAPTLDLGGITYIQGHEVPLKNIIGPKGKDMRLTGRVIELSPNEDGGEQWNLMGSPEAIRKALAGKIQDQASKGKWVKDDKGQLVTIENLDQFLAASMETINNPCVLKKIDFDYLWTWRFFAKLALGVGHYVFGGKFSLSARAAQLRRVMRAETMEEATLPGAVIFPETHSLPPQFAHFKTQNVHTLTVCHGRPRLLMVSLFGWLDACISLDDMPVSEGMIPGEMEVFEITLPDRRFLKYSLYEYMQLRRTKV
jgi:hypothetical protein